jgi:hypothetical protein
MKAKHNDPDTITFSFTGITDSVSIFLTLMSLQSGYNLRDLRFIYTSKVRKDLTATLLTLRKTIKWAGRLENTGVDLPLPSRLLRRAWRVWYNKAPHAIGWSKRHYVFHDWRYLLQYKDVQDLRYVIKGRVRFILDGP